MEVQKFQSSDEQPQVRLVRPEMDVYESETEIRVVADLPGVSKDHLHLDLNQDELVIEGLWQREDALDIRYRRVLRVPQKIDREGISAGLADGVLTLSLPWAAAVQPRRIEVN